MTEGGIERKKKRNFFSLKVGGTIEGNGRLGRGGGGGMGGIKQWSRTEDDEGGR